MSAWPVHDVQAYMGHADIATTMIYVHHQPKTAADALTRIVAAASGAAEIDSATLGVDRVERVCDSDDGG